jgi:hypothetical protein
VRRNISRLLLVAVLTATGCAAALAQTPAAMLGTWTGMVVQNNGVTGFTVVMTIAANAVKTEYPELKCSGKLTRVGAAKGYVFFTETITQGGKNSGGECFDGTITVTPAGNKLVWVWVGGLNGETLVAWSTLERK